MQLNASNVSACLSKSQPCISTENHLFIKKGLQEVINRLWGRRNACKIHSLHQSSTDWLQNHMEGKCNTAGVRENQREKVTETKCTRERERKERKKATCRSIPTLQLSSAALESDADMPIETAHIPPHHSAAERDARCSPWSTVRGEASADDSQLTALNAYTKLMPWLQQLSSARWEQTPPHPIHTLPLLPLLLFFRLHSHSIRLHFLHALEMLLHQCSGGGDVYLSHETLTSDAPAAGNTEGYTSGMPVSAEVKGIVLWWPVMMWCEES